MRTTMIAATLGLTLALPALAQSVDQRHAIQQDRIDRGVSSGQLTPHEARKLERQQHRIDRTERRERDNNGGRLTPHERDRLQAREDRADAKISAKKHNGRTDY